MFEKVINVIWIGDASKEPTACIESWAHGGYEVRVHDNNTLASRPWRLHKKMKYFLENGEINGVADCMRWELMYEEGNFWVDADLSKTRELPDFFLELDAIAAWENEVERPGLIACGFMAFKPKDPLIKHIIDTLVNKPNLPAKAWEVVGPKALTDAFNTKNPDNLTILPSHFFYPRHLTGRTHTSTVNFANHFWGSTFNSY
ncbi:MAG: hypothetical protein EBR82_48125 [Caulobacteraceae bacterium]|nr:hypothetical protein [Caulobacteraceae bacterium]